MILLNDDSLHNKYSLVKGCGASSAAASVRCPAVNRDHKPEGLPCCAG